MTTPEVSQSGVYLPLATECAGKIREIVIPAAEQVCRYLGNLGIQVSLLPRDYLGATYLGHRNFTSGTDMAFNAQRFLATVNKRVGPRLNNLPEVPIADTWVHRGKPRAMLPCGVLLRADDPTVQRMRTESVAIGRMFRESGGRCNRVGAADHVTLFSLRSVDNQPVALPLAIRHEVEGMLWQVMRRADVSTLTFAGLRVGQ